MSKIFYKSISISAIELDHKGDIISLDIEPIGVIHEKDAKNLTTTPYTLAPYEKYFLMPGTVIPRIKMQNLSVDAGIKVVRSPEDADKVFIGKKTFSKISDGAHCYAVSKKLVEAYAYSDTVTTDRHIIDRLQIALLNVEYDYIKVDYTSRNLFIGNTQCNQQALLRNLYNSDPNKLNSNNFSYEHYIVEEDYIELVDKCLNDPNVTLCDEKDLLENLNGDDALVIGETEFEQLRQMFLSSDSDNHVLAMEIMANSNYSQSIFYLLRLFKDYNRRISEQRSKNHVNFKSLVSYLSIGAQAYNWDITVNTMLEVIKTKGLLTLEMIEKCFAAYETEVVNYSTMGGSVIQIKSFTLHPDYAAFLNSNYVKTVKEDFVPVPTVEEPEVNKSTEELIEPKEATISWN